MTRCSTGNAAISNRTDKRRSSAADRQVLAELLASGLAELEVEIDEACAQRLCDLAELVDRWSTRMNLTGHRGAGAVLGRLILDAVALHAAISELEGGWRFGTLADLGSGAGFPGLPIAILAPETSCLLIDSRERRHHFQRTARRELALSNVVPVLGRLEELTPMAADLVVAQALGPPPRVVEWGVDWLSAGGLLVVPGSERPPDPGDQPRIGAHGVGRYRVPGGGPSRTFWWGRPVGP